MTRQGPALLTRASEGSQQCHDGLSRQSFRQHLSSGYRDIYPIQVCVFLQFPECKKWPLTAVFFRCSYPLQILPCRASLSHLFNSPDTPFKHVLLTTFILLLTFLIAMNVTELALVMGIIGSTGSTTVSFILPSLFYLKLFPDNEWKGVRILARALFVMGFVIMFACLGVVIYHGVTGH